MQDNMVIIVTGTFFSLFWLFGLFCVLKPEPIINLTAKFFKWQMNLYGFKAEITITPKAKIVCRIWNIIMLLFTSLFMFLIFTGKLK